jgi:hypothetical protein
MRRRAALLGLICAMAAWACQFLTVHYNYGGNWTALFCIRPGMPVPDFLKSENLYIFQNSEGYDGQVYHLIAHDPWMRKGSAGAIAGASFRYQRIFVPALAWMLALGQDPWIHAAYFAVILALVFLGVYWIAQFAARVGRSPNWGLLFLLVPATIVSLDRMTADIALAAFTAGFAYYALDLPGSARYSSSTWKILIILTCAALTRETALPIIGGYAIFLAARLQILRAILAAATALPSAFWYVYLSRLERSSAPDYVAWIPFAGYVDRIIHPSVYLLNPLKNAVTQVFDYAALAAVAIALMIALRLAFRRRWDARACAIYALALAIVFLRSRSVWEEVYAFGRVFSPFLLLVALDELPANPWLAVAPLVLTGARISLNLAGQVSGVAQGILRALLK